MQKIWKRMIEKGGVGKLVNAKKYWETGEN